MMSKSDPTTNKLKPITIRPSTEFMEGLKWYLETRGGNRTKAIEEAFSIGIAVLLQQEYKNEE